MKSEEAIDIIRAERECVYRQGRTGECCRDDLGCGACDLVQEDANIMEAYDMAIEALKEQRPHGLWVEGVIGYHYCSECHNYALADDDLADDDGKEVLSNFCPNCGADMRKEGETE